MVVYNNGLVVKVAVAMVCMTMLLPFTADSFSMNQGGFGGPSGGFRGGGGGAPYR